MNEQNTGKILHNVRKRLRLSPEHTAFLLRLSRDEILKIERETSAFSAATTELIIYNSLQSLYEKDLKRNLRRWHRRYPHLFTGACDAPSPCGKN